MTFSHKCIQTVHSAFVYDSELWVVVDYMDKVRYWQLARVLRHFFCIDAVQGSLADVIQQLRRSGQVVDERFVFHVASQLLSAM